MITYALGQGDGSAMAATLNAASNYCFDLPDDLKIRIADAVAIMAKIESCMIEIMWLLSEADVTLKRKIARQPLSELAKEIRAAFDQVEEMRDAGGAVWDQLKVLSEERHLVAHGVWLMVDGSPFVQWHKFIEDDDSVMGETFGFDRFDRFEAFAQPVLECFVNLRNVLIQNGS